MNTSVHPSPEDLNACFDHELSPTEQASVEAHVGQCPSCRSELEWFGVLAELGPRVEESLPGESYWKDLPDRVIARVMVEEDVPASSSTVSSARATGWRRFWNPRGSWQVALASAASLAVAGGFWYVLRNQPNPSRPELEVAETAPTSEAAVPVSVSEDGAEFSLLGTATPTSTLPPVPEELEENTPPPAMSHGAYAARLFTTLGSRENPGTSLDIRPGQAVPEPRVNPLGTPVSLPALDPATRAVVDEIAPYGCGEDSLVQTFLAARRAEDAGELRYAALGYKLVRAQAAPVTRLHQEAEYRLNYLAWKTRMQSAWSQQALAMMELNRMADNTYSRWEKTRMETDCRKAWCINRVLLQLGPEVSHPNQLQVTSTRIQELRNCAQ